MPGFTNRPPEVILNGSGAELPRVTRTNRKVEPMLVKKALKSGAHLAWGWAGLLLWTLLLAHRSFAATWLPSEDSASSELDL